MSAHDFFDDKPLLAKSVPKNRRGHEHGPWRLHQHLKDAQAVARVICEVLGGPLLENAGLEGEEWLENLKITTQLQAVTHDLGKAKSRYQFMVYNASDGRVDAPSDDLGRQLVRHEAVSAWLLLHPKGLRSWFLPKGSLKEHPNKACALMAVLGHHVKYCVRGPIQPGISSPNALGKTRMLFDGGDFKKCLAAIGCPTDSQIDLPRDLTADEILEGYSDSQGDHQPGLYDLVEELYDDVLLTETFGYQEGDFTGAFEAEYGRFLAICRALIVSCDVVASAVTRGTNDVEGWARKVLQDNVVTDSALKGVVDKRLGQHQMRPFQKAVGDSSSRVTVLTAGCGSGKTLAAYQWARRNAVGRKLFVSYPTTGTATEGFRDYILEHQFQLNGALVHGRALLDLEHMLSTGDEDQDDHEATQLYGLQLLAAGATVCTADTVLGVMQHHRKGLWASAAILSGAFVFDEVHAYDKIMWDTLLNFIRLQPGARFLLMTATLPQSRLQELRELAAQQEETLECIGGDDARYTELKALEDAKRYKITTQKQADSALRSGLEAAQKHGKRVLIVVNTVGRALQAAQKLRQWGEGQDGAAEILVYHSRFKYKDRLERHNELVAAFGSADQSKGVIGIATQVAEMSLDLDADVLITEMAPPEALIQRLGRLNRKATPGQCKPRPCTIIELPENTKGMLPYSPPQIARAKAWLKRLGKAPCSQRDLAQALLADLTMLDEATPDAPSHLITEPVEASRGQLRQSGVTGSFLTQQDADDARKLEQDRKFDDLHKHMIEHSLPMILPRWWRYTQWHRFKNHYVIPGDCLDYDPNTGGSWNSSRKED